MSFTYKSPVAIVPANRAQFHPQQSEEKTIKRSRSVASIALALLISNANDALAQSPGQTLDRFLNVPESAWKACSSKGMVPDMASMVVAAAVSGGMLTGRCIPCPEGHVIDMANKGCKLNTGSGSRTPSLEAKSVRVK